MKRWPALRLLAVGLLFPCVARGQEAHRRIANSPPGQPQVHTGVTVTSWCKELEGIEWTWRDKSGRTRKRSELDEILTAHNLWAWSAGKSGSRADLNGANLAGADLQDLNLRGVLLDNASLQCAKLNKADLFGARLTGANLLGADLSSAVIKQVDLSDSALNGTILVGAFMTGANLQGASLAQANLSGAYLAGANLTGAYLGETNLTNARLSGTDLSRAFLDGTDLRGASLFGTNLSGTVYEAISEPNIRQMAMARNLELMTYGQNPDALTALRKEFQDSGFKKQEHKITYALNRRQAKLDFWGEHWLKEVAFDFTCQYGMNPWRLLMIAAVLWFACSVSYVMFIHRGGPTGIYRVENQDGKQRLTLIRCEGIATDTGWRYSYYLARREWRLLRTGMFFSLMCAFNIGFRDVNFGRWLRLLTRTEYDLKAMGWTRTVAGFQSLLSFYLYALWILTYFGRPFD